MRYLMILALLITLAGCDGGSGDGELTTPFVDVSGRYRSFGFDCVDKEGIFFEITEGGALTFTQVGREVEAVHEITGFVSHGVVRGRELFLDGEQSRGGLTCSERSACTMAPNNPPSSGECDGTVVCDNGDTVTCTFMLDRQG